MLERRQRARARALCEKHGFELEGVQRMVAFRRGTFADALVMSRLQPAMLPR